jgi:hypothetical protein
MGNCTAIPSFCRTPKSSRKDPRFSTVSSVTNGAPLSSPKRQTYVVHHNLPPLHESPFWIAVKNRRKRASQTNEIKTTRYNILTFLPKNLFEQFHRVANIYFAILIGLNWIPIITAISRDVSGNFSSLSQQIFGQYF